MTRTCILHIGFPKTGTSAIQEALHGYRKDGLAYAGFRDPNHSSSLRILLSKDLRRLMEGPLRHRSMLQLQRQKLRLESKFAADLLGTDDLILSAEGIATHLSPEQLSVLSERLNRHFDRIRVIAYLRPYQSLAPSGFQQSVKMGDARFIAPIPRFRSRIEKFMTQFGRENTELAVFDRSTLAGADIVTDFAGRVGIDPTGLPRSEANTSISLEAMAQMYAHNLFNLRDGNAVSRRNQRIALLKRLENFGEGQFGFTEAFMAKACARHRADLDWASELVGYDMEGVWRPVEEPVRNANHLLTIASRTIVAARQVTSTHPGVRLRSKRRTRQTLSLGKRMFYRLGSVMRGIGRGKVP